MSGDATDLSARLWDERTLLDLLVTAADDPDRALPLLERLAALRLERDVLVHALAEQWGTAPDTATLRSLERIAPTPWDLLLPDHLAALSTATAALDAVVPPGVVRDRWEHLREVPR